MIGRLWRGVTTSENAAKYEDLLRGEVLPGIHRVDGYKGAWLLRRDVPEGAEFVTLTIFESMDAVRRFAGEDAEAAVVRRRRASCSRVSIGGRCITRSWRSPRRVDSRQSAVRTGGDRRSAEDRAWFSDEPALSFARQVRRRERMSAGGPSHAARGGMRPGSARDRFSDR